MKFKELFFYGLTIIFAFANINLPAIDTGTAAPPLKIKKWIKNEPVNYLKNKEEGKVKDILVLCFWATWSNTTDNIFRFLNTEKEMYEKENAVFIAMSKENERIIERYVRARGDVSFSVAADDKAKTYDEYMENTGGVPMFFIIDKSGELIWKGEPFDVDRVLSRLVTNTFDDKKEKEIEKIRTSLRESIQYINLEQQVEYAKRILNLDPIDVAAINIIVDSYIRDDQTEKAIEYMMDSIKKANYNKFIARALYFNLLTIFQGMNNESGRKYLKETADSFLIAFKNDPEALNAFSVALLQGMPMDIVPLKSIYNLMTQAIKVQKETAPDNNNSLGIFHRSLAKVYYLGCKVDKAIEAQQSSKDYLEKADKDDTLIKQAKLLLEYYKSADSFSNDLK